MKAHEVRSWFEIELLRRLRGAEVVAAGAADDGRRAAELARERDLIHLELAVTYRGDRLHQVLCSELSLEDSDGYLVDSIEPRDALDVTLKNGERGAGGVMFAIYDDVEPVRLWLDTGIQFDRGKQPILLDFPLQEPPPRRPATWQEEAALGLDRQLGQQQRPGRRVLPLFETETLMADVSRALGMPYKRTGQGCLFRVALPDGRSQYVMLNFSGADDEGAELIRCITLCAPAGDRTHSAAFLEANPRLCYGGIGLARIEDEEFYIMTETRLVATADVEELAKAVGYLARKGDELEAELTGGADLR